MSHRTERELEELADPHHPREELSPMGELGLEDIALREQRHDERLEMLTSDGLEKPSGGVGTPVGRKGPDPVDTGLSLFEPGMAFLRKIEPIDVKEKLPDLF